MGFDKLSPYEVNTSPCRINRHAPISGPVELHLIQLNLPSFDLRG
jgi:hypothetical protein